MVSTSPPSTSPPPLTAPFFTTHTCQLTHIYPACPHTHTHWQEAGGPWETDEAIADERYVAAAVRGKGLVVFSACSHAGG